MPRGIYRRRRGSRSKNQNKLTSRLMQISLKMDDHIYYNKPVSWAMAEEFLQEVEALKLKCPRKDVRSLQVIEKITSFMKNIIAETSGQVSNLTPTIPAYAGFSQSCSPVYSLPDDDRTENDTVCSDFPIIYNTEDSNDANPEPSNEPNNAIDNVNFAISNMSLHDEVLSQVYILSDDDCSQSILDNYSNNNINVVCNNGNVSGTGHLIDSSTKNPISLAPVSNEINGHYSEIAKPGALINIESSTKNEIDFGTESVPSKFTKNKRKMTSEEKSIKERKSNKIPRKVTKKRKPNFTNSGFGQTEMDIKVNEMKKYKNTRKEHIPKKVTLNEPDVNEAMKIYSLNVENDLSWVENLRYVREIDPDENDPTLCNLEDNFWNNFSLPNQWNDLDFYA